MGGVATPLFQGKGTTWDGGQRVPAIICWKDKIRGGQVSSEVAAMIDWFPTLVKFAGATVPTGRIIDGCDIAPVLFGTGKRAHHDFAYLHNRILHAFRSGEWKIILPEDRYAGNFWVEDVPAHDTLFFNLKSDIAESTDVKRKYPNEYKATLAKMTVFAQTLKDCPPPLVLSESEGVTLTGQQRREAINAAKEKGIKAKSE